MAFTQFTEDENPTMANFNAKLAEVNKRTVVSLNQYEMDIYTDVMTMFASGQSFFYNEKDTTAFFQAVNQLLSKWEFPAFSISMGTGDSYIAFPSGMSIGSSSGLAYWIDFNLTAYYNDTVGWISATIGIGSGGYRIQLRTI